MKTEHDSGAISRRGFLSSAAAVAAAAALPSVAPAFGAAPAQTPKATRMIGIQIGSISFLDEGVDQVLDNVQERGQCNAIFLATFTYGRGIAGRQVPGQPFPDHGKQESDQATFHGGNFATPHAQFYEKTVLKETKAPDHGKDVDILEMVLPKAKKRGMKVYCWYEDVFGRDIPNIEKVQEVTLGGQRSGSLCTANPDYRNFLIGLTEDFCKSYEIDGVMWGCERQGPLNNVIGAGHGGRTPGAGAKCFCEFHEKAGKERGIDVKRVREGYQKLGEFVSAAVVNQRPTDGYFVTFWRLLLDYPEILAWEKLWTDSQQSVYGDIYRTAKASRPSVQVGFHIWHANSFTPFYRAEQNYGEFAKVADYLKIVAYNLCGGPRYVSAINSIGQTIFHDVPREELMQFHNEILGYDDMKYGELSKAGMPADYVGRETRRALEGVQGKCQIYPGIDIDIPTAATEKRTAPDDVYASTLAALKAGAQGVILSRKYSEMRLANLAGAGRAVKEFAG